MARWALDVEVLGGGITNHNLKVSRPTATYVLRIAGKDTELLGIDRSVELEATRAAAAVGVGPDVVDFVEPEGWLVTRFVEGEIPLLERMREPSTLRRVAATLRAFHSGPPVQARFDAFRIVEDYRDHGLRTGRGDAFRRMSWPASSPAASSVYAGPRRSARATTTSSTRTSSTTATGCGSSTGSTPGWATSFFDLANFSVNHGLDEEARDTLLEAYVGALRPGDRRVLELMRFMSDFREAMWGVVQAASRSSTSTSPRTPTSTSRGSSAQPRNRPSATRSAPERRRGARGAPLRSHRYEEYPVSAGTSYPPAVRSSIASSSSAVPIRTGPLNQFLAEISHQPPNKISAPPTVSGA